MPVSERLPHPGTRVVMATGSRAPSRCCSRFSHPRRRRVRGWPGPLPSVRCGSAGTRSPPGSARTARARAHAPSPAGGTCSVARGARNARGHLPGTRVAHMAPLVAGTAPWAPRAVPVPVPVPCPCPFPCPCRGAAGAAAPRSSESSRRESKNSSRLREEALGAPPAASGHRRGARSLHPQEGTDVARCHGGRGRGGGL